MWPFIPRLQLSPFRTSFADRELVRAEAGEMPPGRVTLGSRTDTTSRNDRCVDHNNCFQTFTGRTLVWDFAVYEIRRSPLLGWGYQSFWLVGPDARSIVEG